MKRILRVMDYATVVLVAALYLVALVVSYAFIMQAAAAAMGIWAWLFPAIVDGALLVFSIVILRNSMLGETTRAAWIAAAVAVAVSIALNVWDSATRGNWFEAAIHSIPPIAAAVAFKFLVTLIKSMIRHHETAQQQLRNNFIAYWAGVARAAQLQVSAEIERLNAHIINMGQQNETLTAENETLRAQCDNLRATLAGLRAQPAATQPKPAPQPKTKPAPAHLLSIETLSETRRRVYELKRAQPELTDREIADLISAETGKPISRQAIGNHRRALNGALK